MADNDITMPPAQISTDPGKGAAPAVSAEPVKAMKPDLLDKFTDPQMRKVLEQRAANKPAAIPPVVAATPEVKAAVVTPEVKTPEEKTKAGDEVKKGDLPDSGVIDFTELGKETVPGDDDAPIAELTEAESKDLNLVKAKLTEAHKNNAQQRKLKREAAEALEQQKKQNETLQKELEEARAQKPAATTGNYLDSFTKVEQVQAAREDALETLRQLREKPETEVITLSGNRQWKMTDESGESITSQVAALAFEILENHDARVKQIEARSISEKLVAEKLPVLSKAIPDFDKRYQEALTSDWASEGPKLSLHAALGELVTSGAYVLVPKGKQAPAKTQVAEPKATDLPSTTPPVRPVEAGKVDVTELKAKAMKGDKAALEQWIKLGSPKG